MRKALSISIPEELHSYILDQCRYGSISEYIRGLILLDRQRREDYAIRPVPPLVRANDCLVFAEALAQLERLKTILKRTDRYDD